MSVPAVKQLPVVVDTGRQYVPVRRIRAVGYPAHTDTDNSRDD